jgi:hypothetical protein
MLTTATIVRQLPPDFRLAHGSHASFANGACAMEAVAYIAGEPHTDHPQCASPVLTNFCIRLNDRWRDDERQSLLAVIPKLVGTRGDEARHKRQAFTIVDGFIRELVPAVLDDRKWNDLAEKLRACAPIVNVETARAAKVVCAEVRDEARKRRSAAASASDDDAADADAYAYASAAAADAAADAAYAAAAAAYAAAADAAAARRAVIEKTITILERAIAA